MCTKSIAHIPATFPVTSHTDYVGKDSVFVAIKGDKQDGVLFIPQAIAKGATTLVIHEDAVLPDATSSLIAQLNIRVYKTDNPRKELALLSAVLADNPADKLKIIGITGTKGKTTTTFLLNHLLKSSGYKTAMLSTVHNEIDGGVFPTNLTTPQPDYIHQFLKVCVAEDIEYVVMEVAAQAVSLYRTHGISFESIIFTNLSQEHGEFYATMQDYFDAKCQLFEQLKEGGSLIINSDDSWAQKIIASSQQELQHFSMHDPMAPYQIKQSDASRNYLSATISWRSRSESVNCPVLVGTYNLYNILAATACALEMGVPIESIKGSLQTFPSIPGRLERYFLPNGATCIIDYAHNPSSYQELLSTLRDLTHHLIIVFGCGGERDAARRPVMGGIAARYADEIILTSDNPRSENPHTIIHDIMAGIPEPDHSKVHTVIDRKEAIEYAYARSKPGTIFALLGKGPDEYQIIGTVKSSFSEIEILQSLR